MPDDTHRQPAAGALELVPGVHRPGGVRFLASSRSDEVRYAAQMDRVRSLRHRPVLDTRCGASPPSLNANTESP